MAEIVKTAELGLETEADTESWSFLLNVQTDLSTNTSRPPLSHLNLCCFTTVSWCLAHVSRLWLSSGLVCWLTAWCPENFFRWMGTSS